MKYSYAIYFHFLLGYFYADLLLSTSFAWHKIKSLFHLKLFFWPATIGIVEYGVQKIWGLMLPSLLLAAYANFTRFFKILESLVARILPCVDTFLGLDRLHYTSGAIFYPLGIKTIICAFLNMFI